MKVNIKFVWINLVIIILVTCKPKHKSLESFLIQDGFNIELVASEPLIKDPVDVEFDENGNLMVLEMPGYPFEDEQSRLILLKDLDNDGRYDTCKVFAEGLGMADGFIFYKKGVLVAAPPYLLHLFDQNKDEKVDRIDTLMGGFAKDNLQHNFNGLTYGLDNWIYAANGGNDGKPYWWGDTSSMMDLRGQDLRFNLETKQLERIGRSSGGFGLGIDEYGQIFSTHNIEYISHIVFLDKYLNGKNILAEHTLKNIYNKDENGLVRIYPIGEQEDRVNHPEQSGYFSGACGICYYGGGAFGEKYQNTVWIADVVLNLIHVDKLVSKGTSFSAESIFENKEFLASRDRKFRPVNMSVGPDGSIYVVDMHRKVIEHPEWIPDEIEKNLDLNAGKNQGRIFKISKKFKPKTFDFENFDSELSLIKALEHKNQWVRNTAHRVLVEEGISNFIKLELKNLLNNENELTRLHAFWILHSSKLLTVDDVLKGLEIGSPSFKESILKIAEDFIIKDRVFDKVLNLTKDKNARLRMQAALSLSTVKKLNEKNKNKKFQALLDAAKLDNNDEWNIAALTIAANDNTTELFNKIAESNKPNINLLASLALNIPKTQQDYALVLQSLQSKNLNETDRAFILRHFVDKIELKKGFALEKDIESLENTATPNSLKFLASLRDKLNLKSSSKFIAYCEKAMHNVLDKSLPDSIRIQYLELIETLPYANKSKILYQCLENSQPLKLQEKALWQLSKFREKEIGQKVVGMWQDLSPQTRKHASDLLLYIDSNHDALLTGLEKGVINIGEMNFDLERRRMLIWWTDNEQTKKRANKLFSDAGISSRANVIEKMKPALSLKGNRSHGEKIFIKACSSCHKFGNIGHEVGPVLTEISRKSKATLLSEILDPNAAVDTKYINHLVETKHGLVLTGIVGNETDKAITIKKIGGEKITLNKSDIKVFRSLGSSLMMEGFENSLSTQEMADLIAYLQGV